MFTCVTSNISANIYLFKVSNRNTWKRFEVCSKLTIETLERRHWNCSGVFLLTLTIFHTSFCVSFAYFEYVNVSWDVHTIRIVYRSSCSSMLKVNNVNTTIRYEVSSKLTKKTLKWSHWYLLQVCLNMCDLFCFHQV